MGYAARDDLYSVIVCSVDERRFNALAATLTHSLGDTPYELIRISDARSLCQGYNAGLERSRGSRLIFCHDDIEILNEDFVPRLAANFDRFDVFGLVGTTRLVSGNWFEAGRPDIYGSVVHPGSEERQDVDLTMCSLSPAPVGNVQAVDGMFIGTSREAALRLRWDEANVPGFHLYDIDFSFRAYLMGMRVGVAADLLLFHDSRGSYDPTWASACSAFNRRYVQQLSTGKPRGPGPFVGPCADKHEAYGHFRRHLLAAEAAVAAQQR